MREANEVLDVLELPNYDDVEKRIAEPEMNPTKQRNLKNVIKNADKKRRQMVIMKSHAQWNSKKVKSPEKRET